MKKSIAVAAVLLVACSGAPEELTISNAEVRPLLPGRDVTAAHMVISGGSADDALVAASSPAADVIELHISERENGVSRMRRLDRIDVPAGEDVVLQQGGLHLMLFGLEESELEGGLPVVLEFEQAGGVNVVLEVGE